MNDPISKEAGRKSRGWFRLAAASGGFASLIAVGVLVGRISVVDGPAQTGRSPMPHEAPTGTAHAASAEDDIAEIELTRINIFARLAKKVVPSVVNISTFAMVERPNVMNQEEYFRRFFEEFFGMPGGPRQGPRFHDDEDGRDRRGRREPPQRRRQAMGLGTGFIISEDGLILTNNHVVGDADEIKIRFTEEQGEEPTDGEVIGRDPELDLALIRVKTKRKLVPLKFGDSDKLEVGEYVMAVGNPFGRGHSVSHGIISAKDRVAPGLMARYLQTDAPINPGNSGGPLVNLRGEVIGINNAIDARAQGIGFAIPANQAKGVLPQLREKGTVDRGYIGVHIAELSPEVAVQIGVPKSLRAPFVTHVVPGEPAAEAGMEPYDVIVEVNGRKVESSFDLVRAVTAVPVGEKADVKVLRKGKERRFKLSVTRRPTESKVAQRDHERPKKRNGGPKFKVETGMDVETLTAKRAGQLGLDPKKVQGVVVSHIDFGGPADLAGLQKDDVILEVDKKTVKSEDDLRKILTEEKTYLLRVIRGGSAVNGGEPVFSVVVLDLKKGKKGD